MPKVTAASLQFNQISQTTDCFEFISKLETDDVRAGFGRPVDTEILPTLLVTCIPGCQIIGAWTDGSLAAVAMLARLANRQSELGLIVRSDMKRRQIGTATVHHAFAEARNLGVSEIVAHVRFDNPAALHLLQSLHFKPVGGFDLERLYVAHYLTCQPGCESEVSRDLRC